MNKMISVAPGFQYDNENKIDQSANLYLGWIKDFWMVYCPEVEYKDFKKLLSYDIEFYNESNKKYAKEYYLVDITALNPVDLHLILTQFYAEN